MARPKRLVARKRAISGDGASAQVLKSAGLGDAAFYDGYASISVLKGDAYVRIAVGVASPLGPEKTLAADAVPRM